MLQSFTALGVSAPVVEALSRLGIRSPFAIQALVLPDALAGVDVLAASPTGSGKTLAFGIPLIERTVDASAHPGCARPRPDARARFADRRRARSRSPGRGT